MRPDFLSLQGAFVGTIGQWVNIFFVIFALLIITGAIDDSFESLQGLKRHIQEQLLKSNEQLEKSRMNYLLQRIEDAKPMNACGYFEIGKSTLTSMLSVRLVKIKHIHIFTSKLILQFLILAI